MRCTGITSCNNNSIKEDSNQKDNSISSNNVAIISDVNERKNIINENTFSPYKEVDSLVRLIEKEYSLSAIKKLDSICSNIDGDLSESLGETIFKLFQDNIHQVTNYMLNNPDSCLEDKLVQGIGFELSVYEKIERKDELLKEQERIENKAEKEKVSGKQLKFIREIFKKVNPNLLD